MRESLPGVWGRGRPENARHGRALADGASAAMLPPSLP